MMFQLLLKTVAIRPDGCYSVMCVEEGPHYDPRPFAVTCERTFEDVRPVIQNGRWRCKKTWYYKGDYATFEIIIPGHSRVLFHRGNKETDSEACVLIAESYDMMDGQTAILQSKHGFNEFWELVKHLDEFELVVTGR